MSTSSTYTIPTAPSPAIGTWTTTFVSGSGGSVEDLNGIGYGELLNSQTGEALCINSMTLQVYESSLFDENERIAQLLQPIKFNRKLVNGNARDKVLAPTVDIYQKSTTLENLTLGYEANDYVLDGRTSLKFTLLPFAKINLQLKYTILTNYVFGQPELLKKVIELNKTNIQRAIANSKVRRGYEIKNIINGRL